MLNVITVATLGFLLGMRHATDADHVIAVSTIFSRQPSIRSAGLIGMLWGLGHTVTIMSVGAAIILFNMTIPPRVGLAMELAVGLMLVVLGVLNLTGVMQWAIARFASNDGPRLQVPLDDVQRWPLLQNVRERIGLFQVFRPLIVGIVHGLASLGRGPCGQRGRWLLQADATCLSQNLVGVCEMNASGAICLRRHSATGRA